MTKNRTLFLLILVMIVAGFLRLYHFTTVTPGLYPDEAMNGNDGIVAMESVVMF